MKTATCSPSGMAGSSAPGIRRAHGPVGRERHEAIGRAMHDEGGDGNLLQRVARPLRYPDIVLGPREPLRQSGRGTLQQRPEERPRLRVAERPVRTTGSGMDRAAAASGSRSARRCMTRVDAVIVDILVSHFADAHASRPRRGASVRS